VDAHSQHKEDKLRHRLSDERKKKCEISKEMELKERDMQENYVFCLADTSYSESECNEREKSKLCDSANASKFDKHKSAHSTERGKNFKELVEKAKKEMRDKNKIMCGAKIERKVILRSFHDRSVSEPRGKSNSFNEKKTVYSTCMTHHQWLNHISNDSKFNVRK
jgi:hypothetical protein